MATHLEPDAPRSINCIRYLVSELLKREPLKYGKTIKVRISEDSANFPEFTDNILEDNQNLKPERRLEAMDKDMGHKLIAISKFLVDKFKYHTAVLMPQVQSFDPFVLDIPLVSLDPKGLYEMADKLESKNNKSEIILCLDKVGNLWREPKSKFCYPIDENSNRHKIIRYLAESKEYRLTVAIASVLGISNKQYIRGEIPKINNNAKRFLKLNGGKLIESRPGSGYRISPNYKIKVLRI